MVRIEVRELYSSDERMPAGNLRDWQPQHSMELHIQVEASIGVVGQQGAEIFSFWVCDVAWLQRELRHRPYHWGRHHIVVPKWNFDLVVSAVSNLCSEAPDADFIEIASYLTQFGAWEGEYWLYGV